VPCPIIKLEDHPLPAVHNCLFNISAVPFTSGGCLLHQQPEDVSCCGERNPYNHVTTDLYYKDASSEMASE